MKKLLASLIFLCSSSSVQAIEVLLESKVAYHHPTGGRFHDIYHDGVSVGGELTVPVCGCFALWGSGDYFSRKGHSIGLNNSTKVEMFPLAVGVKYFLPVWIADLYLGVGVDWTWIRTHDNSPFVISHIDRNAWGARFKGGGLIDITENIFVDLFVEYTWNKAYFKNHFNGEVYLNSADISHLNAGLGIGYRFGVF